MAEFADASDRREAMKNFLAEPAAAEVESQTPAADPAEDAEEVIIPGETEEAETTEETTEEAEEVETEEEQTEEETEEEETEEGAKTEDLEEPETDETETPTPEKLQVLNDRNEAFEGLAEALDATEYPIDFGETPEKLAEGMKEVGLRLGDAHALYDLMQGKGAAVVFERLKKFQGQQAHDFALNEVLKYAAQVGMIESTEAAGDGTGKDKDGKTTKTEREKQLEAENDKLKREQLNNTTKTNEEAALKKRIDVATKATDAAWAHAESVGMSKEDYDLFVMPQFRGIGHDKAVFNRCARGNYVDLIKKVDEVNGRLTGKKVAAANTRVQQRKTRDAKVPKRVAGEDRTAHRPAASQTTDLSTSEGRRAAAKAGLRA